MRKAQSVSGAGLVGTLYAVYIDFMRYAIVRRKRYLPYKTADEDGVLSVLHVTAGLIWEAVQYIEMRGASAGNLRGEAVTLGRQTIPIHHAM